MVGMEEVIVVVVVMVVVVFCGYVDGSGGCDVDVCGVCGCGVSCIDGCFVGGLVGYGGGGGYICFINALVKSISILYFV
jgi:hypothetical protein